MSVLVKIGVILVAGLLIFSLIAPLLGPLGSFFQGRVLPFAGGGDETAALSGGESAPQAADAVQPENTMQPKDAVQDYKIITLLGFDAIPAILSPEFVGVDVAEEWMSEDEQVIGLSINGDNRAYSIPMLSRHEIVNDVVGGEPVALTW